MAVRDIARIVVDAVSPRAEIAFGTTAGGWIGDVPRFSYAVERLRRLGWRGGRSSEAAIRQAVAEVVEQEREALCSP